MFCDLVGSTALSAGLDPEDMREVIRSYQDACAGIITRFEGFVAKFMGDDVLAYFGWPRAHEDEAERAVRAGLALVEAVGSLSAPAGEPLAIRVGIATGMVVVGDLVGEGAAQEQAVVGDTPNLAARLQGMAHPGQVVIAGATRRLLGQRFELTDLGPQALKGIAAPVEAFAVQAERAMVSRFEAHRGQLQPMVGRDHELALLLERWTQAKAGAGQGMLLVGEAGIGKSRITRALLDVLADEPHARLRYQCSPYHTDSALWPVIQQLTRAAGFIPEDSLETRLLANAHTLAWALSCFALVQAFRRDPKAVRATEGEAIELARTHRMPQWLAWSTFFHGWATVQMEDFSAGIAAMEDGLARWHATGAVLSTTLLHGLFAAALLKAGAPKRGRAELQTAFAHADSFGERFMEAELYRIEAVLRQREGASPERVETALRRAMELAETQNAAMWRLRAAIDLTRLWRDQGKRAQARDLLAPIYGGFTDGTGTPDLTEARALLAELD